MSALAKGTADRCTEPRSARGRRQHDPVQVQLISSDYPNLLARSQPSKSCRAPHRLAADTCAAADGSWRAGPISA